MDTWKMGFAVLATLLMAGTAIAANDSTSVEEVDVPWQPPSYAGRAGSADTANTANYAATAGATGYATNAGSANTAGSAATAGSANAATAAGYASTTGYASSAGNGVAGVDGSNLTLSNGTTHTLPSGGGGGGSAKGACSGSQSGSFDEWTSCWGTAAAPVPTYGVAQYGYCTNGTTITGCGYLLNGYCIAGHSSSFQCK